MPDVRAQLIISAVDQTAAASQSAAQNTQAVTATTTQATASMSAMGTVSAVVSTGMIALAGATIAVGLATREAKSAYDATIGSAVSLGNEVRKLQFETGASAEQASKLAYAADITGISVDQLSRGINIATRALANHKSLGIEPNIDGLAILADRYNAIEDPIQRNAFLLHEFGRSGADLAPLMQLGSAGIRALGDQATLTGNVLDQQATTQLHNYDMQVKQLTLDTKGLGVALGVELAPAATRVVDGGLNLVHTFDLITAAQKAGIITAFGQDAIYVELATGVRTLSSVYYDLAPKLQKINDDLVHGSDASDRAAAASKYLSGQQSVLTDDTIANGNATNTAAFQHGVYAKQLQAEATQQYLAGAAIQAATDKIELQTAMAGKLTNQMIFQTASVGLNSDEQLALARSLGLVDEATLKSIRSVQNLQDAHNKGLITTGQFISGVDGVANSTDNAANSVNNLAERIAALHDQTVTVTTNFVSHGSPGWHDQGSGGGGGAAGGADFIVPPGYPNDSYPLRVQSGEHVQVTPAGQSGSGGSNKSDVMLAALMSQLPAMMARAVRDAMQTR